MKLSKYLTKEENRVSVLKNVPIQYLKEVQQKVGTIVKVMNHYSSICETKVRYEYGPGKTRKENAEIVSVYFRVKATCPGLSDNAEKVFKEILKKSFSEVISNAK